MIFRIGVLMISLAVVTGSAPRAEEPPSAELPPADVATFGLELSAEDRAHWSFQPIGRPAPPFVVEDAGWISNPIDAFISGRLRGRGLAPSPPATDLAWLRRVTLDLVGLPPTPDEVAEFLADDAPERRERVVDRLLADPGYGIRWGRRWLDVARYADTNGYERDGAKPHAWRYRDWVIAAFNADQPFDRFLTEQLAGDELDDADAESMIATTFLRLGTWDDEPADEQIDRYDQLDDVVGTVSAAFLGLTLRCARCHNHKFEPLSQIDYSRMLAIFEPLRRPQNGRTDLDLPVGTAAELADARAADARHSAAIRAIDEQIAALDERVRLRFLESGASGLAADAQAAHRLADAQRTEAQKKLVKETLKKLDEEAAPSRTVDERRQRDGFQAALAALRDAAPSALPRAYIWEEPVGAVPVTRVFRRGNPATPAGTVPPGYPQVLSASQVEALPPVERTGTTRRRLSLARWLTDPRNPLTARVIVNRLWQGHFGNGLVATENDFGVMGLLPTHPELLDWLASELREPSGMARIPATDPAQPAPGAWSLKRLHRLIVLSGVYGQSSDSRPEALRADAENSLLWRYPYRRLEAEAVRDAVLAVNGRLNRQMTGPGVYPRIAREVLEGQSKPGDGWGAADEAQASRRAAYIFVKRSLLVPEMELLDFADTNASCEQRPVSTIPTQALTLLNGEFLNQEAARLAERLAADAGPDRAAQIERAFRLALSRPPTADESAAALAFLDRQAAQVAAEDAASAAAPPRDAARTALAAFCLVLYNLNEFAYVD